MHKNPMFSKDFILVAIGQIISIFGNQIVRFALPLYLLNQTGSSVLFGTILAVSFIPMLLLFPLGGIIADRLNKRNIMVILDFSTAILIFLFYVLSGKIDIVPLVAVTMIILYSIQGAYQPAVQASVPILVGAEHIMQGNSVINLISSLGSMVGSVLGGILFSLVGLAPILYVSVGCFSASAVMEIFIHIPFEKRKPTGNIFVTGFNDLKDSFVFMFKERPVLWKVSVIYASVNLFLTPLILIGFPVLITQHLGFTSNTANRLYGYAQGVVAAGAISGGLLAGILSTKLKSRASPLILLGCSVSVLIGGIALRTLKGSMEIYIILVIGGGLLTALSTLFQIQVITNLQILTPKELTGKVISCVICLCMCTIPLGQFLYGIVFEKIGSNTYLPFYVSGLLMIGIGVFTRRIFYGIDQLIEG
ncbi:permease [Treponema primitia ZAS-2]|uniref:Permease n=1 Tax=Treponema primitia (strain ATCC BAA-887 / DSM 12427 / ZAS-2) TaxID=545694 RepID=F5YGS4_TREPZ|nr:MFS transporter [Treponema primitia]AEF83529.1 permease [Treponema primitia ZAS-2]